MEIVSPFFQVHDGVAAPTATSSGDDDSHFRIDELEVIFESLSDILSDGTMLPSLFASFDCNPTSIDLVQPLVKYICRSCW